MDRKFTAAHWGIYQAEADGSGGATIAPWTRDRDPSPISTDLADLASTRGRLGRPLVRAGYLAAGEKSDRTRRGVEPFVEVGWDVAVDLAAKALKRTKERLGNKGIYAGSYGWASAGRFHHAQSQLRRFMNLFGGCTGSVNSYSSAAAEVVVPHILGSVEMTGVSPGWDEMAAHTKLLVAFGGLKFKNAQIGVGLTGPHVDRAKLAAAHANGLHVVCIDPVYGEDEEAVGAEWIAPRPNTDVALMLGLAHTLVAENLHDPAFLARCCFGGDRFIDYVMGRTDGVAKTPAWAAAITGIAADVIADLARRMAATRTVVNTAWSLQRADKGEQPVWMVVALGCLLGQVGLPGGGFSLGLGTFNNKGAGKLPFAWAEFPAERGEVRDRIPVARVTDMLLNPGATITYDGRSITYNEIGLVYWTGGNPFHHHQDLHRLVAALRRPETVIVNEPWFTPMARMSDIVFPITTTLERNDFATSRYDGWVTPMHKLREPYGEAGSDYDVFSRLAARLGFGDAFTQKRTEMEWIRHMFDWSRQRAAEAGIDLPDFDAFWNGEPILVPGCVNAAAKLAALRADPQANPLGTPSGRIQIVSPAIEAMNLADCPAHPTWMEPREWLGGQGADRFPLHLLSDQPGARLHSQLDGGRHSQEGKVGGREPCVLNVDDAAARGIKAGDTVRVFNDRGSCLAGAVLSEKLRPGCIKLSTGAWFDPERAGDPLSVERNGNPNTLTYDAGCSGLSQGPSAFTCLVQVERHARPAAARTAVYDIPLAAAR